MGIVEALDKTASDAAETGKAYLSINMAYYELKVFQKVAVLATFCSRIALYGISCILGLIFFAIAGASVLNDYFDSDIWGQVIVGVIFFVLLLLAYLYRKSIDNHVLRKLSEKYFDEK